MSKTRTDRPQRGDVRPAAAVVRVAMGSSAAITALRPAIQSAAVEKAAFPQLAQARACVLALLLLLLSGPLALAQSESVTQDTGLIGSLNSKVDTNQPMLLQADELVYDNKNDRVTARGNVEIYFNNYTLLADEVIYDQGKSTLEAAGNVRIKEPNGAVVNADRITLTEDFKDGFIQSLRVVAKDDSRIAAASATRDGNVTTFERGIYTPCKACQDNPEKTPTWRIKATKIVHDQGAANISYEDATFELFGVPVAYAPYFQHADPTVKRRSGFLMPEMTTSTELGFTVSVPYFYNLAPDKDFTFSPVYMSEQGLLLKGEWRQRFADGTYSIELAGIFRDDDNPETDFTITGDQEFRGSVKSKGRFDLGSWWQFGWDVTAETDDTFRRFYKLDDVIKTDRVSSVYLTGQSERNYFGAHLYHFGALLPTDTADSESVVHPSIDYNYIFANPILGGELSFDANVVALSRDEATDSNRLIAEVKWRRQMIDGIGQVVTPFASARGDLYKVSNVIDPNTLNAVETEDRVGRGFLMAGLQYQYPFVAHSDFGSHVLEPVAQIIARPDSIEQVGVPNEDARSLVFDDTLLFDTDKFSGYDRIETGIRANYGLQYTLQMNNGAYVRAVIGQSRHISGDNAFSLNSGLGTDGSDYVAGLYMRPNENIQLIAQTRLDEDSFDINRQDLSAELNYGPASTKIGYAFQRREGDLVNLETVEEEVTLAARLQLTETWSIFGGVRYDIEDDWIVSNSLGVQYGDDCFTLAVTYAERNINDRDDIEPERSVMFRFELKNLGGFKIKTDAIDQLVASDG